MGDVTYWYFRFVKDFFNDNAILEMETRPGGFEYLAILLKLYCHSVDHYGVLEVRARNVKDVAFLSHVLRHSSVAITEAMDFFLEKGLIEIDDITPEGMMIISMPYVKKMIGKSSRRADKSREERWQEERRRAQLTSGEENFKRGKLFRYGIFDNVYLTSNEHERFSSEYQNADEIIEKLSIYKRKTGKTYEDDYAALLSFAADAGVKVSKKAALEEYYKYLHEKAKNEAELRKEEIYKKIPSLLQIDNNINDLIKEQAFSFSKLDLEQKKKIDEKIQRYRKERIGLLTEHGYTEEDMLPQYKCEKCEDTGLLDSGALCDCRKEREKEALKWKKGESDEQQD